VERVIHGVVRRFVLGASFVLLGGVWCLANDYYWQTKIASIPVGSGYPAIGPATFAFASSDLTMIAIPFYVLGAAAFLGRPRLIGASVVLVGLAVFTSLAYDANAARTSSTAPLVFLASIFYGVVLVAGAVFAQVLVDAVRSRHSRDFVESLSEVDQLAWARFISQDNGR
jgi:hypothetical protein